MTLGSFSVTCEPGREFGDGIPLAEAVNGGQENKEVGRQKVAGKTEQYYRNGAWDFDVGYLSLDVGLTDGT